MQYVITDTHLDMFTDRDLRTAVVGHRIRPRCLLTAGPIGGRAERRGVGPRTLSHPRDLLSVPASLPGPGPDRPARCY